MIDHLKSMLRNVENMRARWAFSSTNQKTKYVEEKFTNLIEVQDHPQKDDDMAITTHKGYD